MIYNDVLEAVGNTPLIRLNRMTGPDEAEVLVKFEAVNVGGSIKTRTAMNMIEAAEKKGLIHKDTIIVEPTSGNQGIGLALIGAVKGYKTVIIMPDSVSEERRKLVKNYGAQVILIHDAGNIGDCIAKCMETALSMAKEDPNVYVPQQFENEANSAAHREQTALEQAEPSPVSAKPLRQQIRIWRSGPSSLRMPRYCPAKRWDPICRWESAMELYQPY